MSRFNTTVRRLPLLIVLALSIASAGCKPEPPPLPPKPSPPDLPQPPVPPGGGVEPATPADLSLLTEEWNADEKVAWELSELLGDLADNAYLDEDEAVAAFKGVGFESVKPHRVDSTVGYVATQGSLTVVAFRGTDDIGDWFVNLNVNWKKVTGGDMHAGFHDAYQLLAADIQADVEAAQPKYLWITGHSLGGALAVVCAHQFLEQQIPIHGVVTFGQPMVAKTNLVAHLNAHLPGKYARFINNADIVPRVPPLFEHAGSSVWFKSDGFTHAKATAQKSLRSGDIQLANQLPDEPPPLSEEEFRKLQAQLKQQQEPAAFDGQRKMKAMGLPFLDDHAMLGYLTRLGLKGEPSGDEKAAPQLPGTLELPSQPALSPAPEESAKPKPPKLPSAPPRPPLPRLP